MLPRILAAHGYNIEQICEIIFFIDNSPIATHLFCFELLNNSMPITFQKDCVKDEGGKHVSWIMCCVRVCMWCGGMGNLK